MNDAYMPKPSRNATEFVVQTPRIRIIRMSTSGSSDRVSFQTQNASTTTPAPMQPSVFADSQCHVAVWLTATSTSTRPVLMRIAESQLTRLGTRTGDSGTTMYVSTVATTIGTSGSQK